MNTKFSKLIFQALSFSGSFVSKEISCISAPIPQHLAIKVIKCWIDLWSRYIEFNIEITDILMTV